MNEVELLAGGAELAVAYLSKDGIEKSLGPTAEYLGEGLKELVKSRAEAVNRIFKNASDKLGDKGDSQGTVPPKVLKFIMDDGSFASDDLSIEYLGGILASSRTELGRDDRGARMAKIVDGLSTYQLRTHYLIYSSIKSLFADKGLFLGMDSGREKMQIFIPLSGFIQALDLNEKELTQIMALLTHIFFGLQQESLIESNWEYNEQKYIVKRFSKATEDGIVCCPSALGTALYLSAFGYCDKELEFIFSHDFDSSVEGIPNGITGVCSTAD